MSRKELIRRDGSREPLPSKIDLIPVEPGDRLVFVTAGAGGLGAPEDRDPAATQTDLRRALISPETAREQYGLNQEDA